MTGRDPTVGVLIAWVSTNRGHPRHAAVYLLVINVSRPSITTDYNWP